MKKAYFQASSTIRPPIENMPLYIATMTQTAIGIFLLSVFGFMAANKIRKS